MSAYSGDEAANSGKHPRGGQQLVAEAGTLLTGTEGSAAVESDVAIIGWEASGGGGTADDPPCSNIEEEEQDKLLRTVIASGHNVGHETRRTARRPEHKLGKCWRMTASKLLRNVAKSAALLASSDETSSTVPP